MLASIQKVISLSPIEGADSIEKATILGWEVVVKKGEYKVGDLCIYIQIDTVLPETELFEFMRPRKFRVKTIRLRGQISQGIVFPVNEMVVKHFEVKEGQDVTEMMGVKKYEKSDTNPRFQKEQRPRQPKKGYKRWLHLFKYKVLYRFFPRLEKLSTSPFPKELVSMTDEPRIQNMPQVLEQWKGNRFYLNYKLDGSSITIIHEKKFGKSNFRICSRRLELHNKDNDWQRVFDATNFSEHILKLVDFFGTDNIIVQGEAIGKFNGNHHALKEDEIRLFNIFVDGIKITQGFYQFVCQNLKIPHCPLFKALTLDHSLEEVLKMSELPDVLNPKAPAEGLVWRSVDGELSFKAINNAFLLKKKE